METSEARIAKIFNKNDVPKVCKETLLGYRQHILRDFDRTAILTGREDFPWEEKYVFGGGSRVEYEKLKRIHPSYTDEYELIDISEDIIEENDLVSALKRLSDGKRFEIGLSWLETKNKKSKDHQLLDDFATWVANW